MTVLALHPKPTFVNIILAMAADAIARQAGQQVRSVAALTGTGQVGPGQWKPRSAVVEQDKFDPVPGGGIVALPAQPSQPTHVHILADMAVDTLSRDAGQLGIHMALRTEHGHVLSNQWESSQSVLEGEDLIPPKRGVTAGAVRAEAAFVNIDRTVTGDAVLGSLS